jgi:hypothetical protein
MEELQDLKKLLSVLAMDIPHHGRNPSTPRFAVDTQHSREGRLLVEIERRAKCRKGKGIG